MSDGIADGRRARGLQDILDTGAAYITERELDELGEELRRLRYAVPLLLDIEKHGPAVKYVLDLASKRRLRSCS